MQWKFFFILLIMCLFAYTSCKSPIKSITNESNNVDIFTKKMIVIEKRVNARLGVMIIDEENNREWGYHTDDRFPMCSTAKAMICASVLTKVDSGKENLQRRIAFEKNDLIVWSPVTETRLDGNGMSIAELCEAAITQSDNTAANLILNILGGPQEVTDFVKTLGDQVTRLDRIEPDLNEAAIGDKRDTTTPHAMANNLRALLLENALSDRSREQLKTWLIANKTGDARLRAAMPKDWIVGDKTGTGAHGTTNDIAIIWPPNRKPIIVAVYITQSPTQQNDLNSAIADVGKILVQLVTQ